MTDRPEGRSGERRRERWDPIFDQGGVHGHLDLREDTDRRARPDSGDRSTEVCRHCGLTGIKKSGAGWFCIGCQQPWEPDSGGTPSERERVIDLMAALKESLTRPCECGHPFNEHANEQRRPGPCEHCGCEGFREPEPAYVEGALYRMIGGVFEPVAGSGGTEDAERIQAITDILGRAGIGQGTIGVGAFNNLVRRLARLRSHESPELVAILRDALEAHGYIGFAGQMCGPDLYDCEACGVSGEARRDRPGGPTYYDEPFPHADDCWVVRARALIPAPEPRGEG